MTNPIEPLKTYDKTAPFPTRPSPTTTSTTCTTPGRRMPHNPRADLRMPQAAAPSSGHAGDRPPQLPYRARFGQHRIACHLASPIDSKWCRSHVPSSPSQVVTDGQGSGAPSVICAQTLFWLFAGPLQQPASEAKLTLSYLCLFYLLLCAFWVWINNLHQHRDISLANNSNFMLQIHLFYIILW
jgi:hypothetical protein